MVVEVSHTRAVTTSFPTIQTIAYLQLYTDDLKLARVEGKGIWELETSNKQNTEVPEGCR